MDLLVRCLSHKHEGLSSYPLDLCEKPGMVVHTNTLSSGKVEDRMVPGLVSQLVLLTC